MLGGDGGDGGGVSPGKGDDGVYMTPVIYLYIPPLWSYVTGIIVDTVVSRWYMCIAVLCSFLTVMSLTLMSGQTDIEFISDDCKSRIKNQSIEGLVIWIRQTNGRVCSDIITVEYSWLHLRYFPHSIPPV